MIAVNPFKPLMIYSKQVCLFQCITQLNSRRRSLLQTPFFSTIWDNLTKKAPVLGKIFHHTSNKQTQADQDPPPPTPAHTLLLLHP